MFQKDGLVKNVEASKIEGAKGREERNRVEEREINWIHSGIDKAGR
jgi:hypothetical protein